MRETKLYVGAKFDGKREVFYAEEDPNIHKYGRKYRFCVGPCKDQLVAEFLAGPGWNMLHCTTPNDAERLARVTGFIHQKR